MNILTKRVNWYRYTYFLIYFLMRYASHCNQVFMQANQYLCILIHKYFKDFRLVYQ